MVAAPPLAQTVTVWTSALVAGLLLLLVYQRWRRYRQRRALAGARHAAEWRLDAVVDQGLAGIAEADLDGHLLRVNDRYCEIAGQSRAALLGAHLRDFTLPADWAQERSVACRS